MSDLKPYMYTKVHRIKQALKVGDLKVTHVYVLDRYVYVVEQFRVVFDAGAGGEEYHTFLVLVLLDEGEEEHEPLVWGTHNVALENDG